MFSKSRTSDIQETAEQLVETTRDNVREIARDTGKSVNAIGSEIKDKSLETREEALALLASVREIIDTETLTAEAGKLTEQITTQLAEWKDDLMREVSKNYKVSKTSTERFIRKRSLLALSIAVGTGVAVGYLLANRSNEDEA
jgi:ElaB/YqjD/DUF883 family membrane-anchored ribosome-binding protein